MSTECPTMDDRGGRRPRLFRHLSRRPAAVVAPTKEILSLTNAISPWLYVVLASGVSRALVRCLGRARNTVVR